MSVTIELQAVPNQSFSVQLDGQRYSIAIKEASGIMAATVAVNEEVVISGARIVAGAPLLPYEYLQGDGGNFILLTELDDLPYYTAFGSTQTLVYLTAEEVATTNAA